MCSSPPSKTAAVYPPRSETAERHYYTTMHGRRARPARGAEYVCEHFFLHKDPREEERRASMRGSSTTTLGTVFATFVHLVRRLRVCRMPCGRLQCCMRFSVPRKRPMYVFAGASLRSTRYCASLIGGPTTVGAHAASRAASACWNNAKCVTGEKCNIILYMRLTVCTEEEVSSTWSRQANSGGLSCIFGIVCLLGACQMKITCPSDLKSNTAIARLLKQLAGSIRLRHSHPNQTYAYTR